MGCRLSKTTWRIYMHFTLLMVIAATAIIAVVTAVSAKWMDANIDPNTDTS